MRASTMSQQPIPPPQKPKQKQLGKTKGDLKSRAKKIVKALLDGKTETEAVKCAGYSPAYANSGKHVIMNNPVILKTIREIYERAGITDDYLARKNEELLNAREMKFFQEKGIVTDSREVDDNGTRLGALKLAHQLKGNLVEKTQEMGELVIKVVRYGD